MSPPGKEKGALQGALFHSQNYDGNSVAQEGAVSNVVPKSVQALTAVGAEFHWRKSAGDLIGTCPLCRGKLIIDQDQPWALCLGEIHCRAGQLPFDELLTEIARKK